MNDQDLQSQGQRGSRHRGAPAVIGIPSGVTGVRARAVREAGLAGAGRCIDRRTGGAAIGAGRGAETGSPLWIVDIGGGHHDVAC